jgi:hypothetical protein
MQNFKFSPSPLENASLRTGIKFAEYDERLYTL